MHRRRRNAISGFFSTASIRRLEPIIQEHLKKLLARMQDAGKASEVLPMHYVFRAFTSDLITEYAFGDSFHFLEKSDFAMPYMLSTDVFFILNHTFCHFPWVGTLLALAPPWAVKTFIPSLTEMWDKQMMWIEKVEEIRNSKNPDSAKNTIFEGILNSKLPDEEKTIPRLAHEAQLVVFAGEGTTAYTLQAAIYQLLANPAVFHKVKAEITAALPDPEKVPSFAKVEKLPYLSAIIQETVRLHPGRKGIAHMNPEAFEDPHEFRPQRWIDNPRLDKGFIGFARGTRNCIGMNFARQEMSMVLASIIRKYDIYNGQEGPSLELFDTTRERDIDLNQDYIIPFPAKGSQGLRIKVRN
ncbi:hypothetical protein COL154_004374 [Colletotrichum chrysophilum]|nr:hypothetical protein COL154_004374 [Colletotrichum chrysophilum]